MTSSYEFEKAQQELIAQQAALIRQLGKALEEVPRQALWERQDRMVEAALKAYDDWKAMQS